MTVPEFEARRVLAEADLGTARGRDHALERIRPLIEATPPNSATRQELVRFVADRVDVPTHYLMTPPATIAPATAAGNGMPPHDARRKRETTFLSMCLADPANGREYLERLADDHLTSDLLRRVRDWLRDHFDEPLAELPSDDPSLAAAVSAIVMASEARPEESLLRVSFLELEQWRLRRALRHAGEEQDLERQRELTAELKTVDDELRELLGAV